MATNAVSLVIDDEHLLHALQQVHKQLETAGGEVVLDLTAVRRIDPGALAAMEQLAAAAQEKSANVALRGVNVDVYKVLKLVKLAPRFRFV